MMFSDWMQLSININVVDPLANPNAAKIGVFYV
jgi:hypothetical protein